MSRTSIDWCRNPPDNKTQGYTLNPTVGCSGKGCAVYDVCYARRIAKRFKPYVDKNGRERGCQLCYEFKPHYHMERMLQLKKLKKPSGVFLSSMSDLFDENLGWYMVRSIINQFYTQHRFYLLTKQPQNAKYYGEYPPNVWFGVTVNRRSDLWRIDELRQVYAKVKFVSFEPLMEELGDINLDGVNWIIIGAQTRPAVQPPKYAVEQILGAARFAGIPVFMKRNLLEFHGYLKQKFPKEVLSK